MRVLHTSDWHLGRSFGGQSLIDEQRAMVGRITELAADREVDLVIIAGDLFDRALPPAEAVELFDEAIADLRAIGAKVAAISGNHDSPVRVSAHDRLLAEAGVMIRGNVERCAEPMMVEADLGPVAVYGIPYLEPAVAAPVLGAHTEVATSTTPAPLSVAPPAHSRAHSPSPVEYSAPTLFDDPADAVDEPEPQVETEVEIEVPVPVPVRAPVEAETTGRRPRVGHHQVTWAATQAIRADLATRGAAGSIVLAHVFLTGGEKCESERELTMGNLGTVGIDAFDDFDYVALGHLHNRQSFRDGRVSYSGTPLPYSFSEENHPKSVNIVTLGPDGSVEIERELLGVGRRLATISGTLQELLDSREFDGLENARVRAHLTDRHLQVQSMARLQQRFPYAVELRHRPATDLESSTEGQQRPSASERRALDPPAVTEAFFAEAYSLGINEAEQRLLNEAFAAAGEAAVDSEPALAVPS